jgi:hypothetical protein
MVPAGKDDVVMTSDTGATDRESVTDLVWLGFAASAAVAVKVEVPAVVGTPEIMPVFAVRLRPAGRLPEAMDQV